MSSADVPGLRPPGGGRPARCLLALIVTLDVALGAGAIRHAVQSNFDTDEVEHAHVIWSMNQGIAPYRDLHQVHTPLLWIVFAPIVRCLPSCVETLIVLRAGCLAAFFGAFVAGLLVVREIVGRLSPTGIATMLLVMLSALPALEMYRFRPDPLMTLLAACAVLAAVRLRRAPVWYSTLGGIAMGLGAGFSPKLAPLCLLVPVLCLFQCAAGRSLRPLRLIGPNALGLAIGIFPTAVWLFGHGLVRPFAFWVVSTNAHGLQGLTGPLMALAGPAESRANLLLVLAAACGLLVAWRCRPVTGADWPPHSALFVAASLSCLIPAIEPNHQTYNLQASAMPVAALATILVLRRSESDSWRKWPQPAAVGALLLLIASVPVMRAVDLRAPGYTISVADMRNLIELCRGEGTTCVGFAPWHPVFCRDATGLYTVWDCWLAEMPGARARYGPFVDLWPAAIDAIENRPPRLIVDWGLWRSIHKSGVISDEQYGRFQRLVTGHYRPVRVGDATAFVRQTAGVR